MGISTEAIKEVRNRTNVGILECKDALLKADGSVDKAVEILRGRGLAIAEKKVERVTTEGMIEAYIHHTGQVGALVEVNCETDFVAHTTEFRELAHNLAMQVAATSPQFITAEEIPAGAELDPQTACLLLQPFIKEPSKTVREVIAEAVAKVGENIKVSRFTRFELGC
jgi:elongation factor Ts